jgi:hypothetical protein
MPFLSPRFQAVSTRLRSMRPGRWGVAALVVTAARLAMSFAYRPHYFLTASFDDGNYIARAEMMTGGSWATVFDRQTFLRGPLYAMYLAVVAGSGVPLAVVDMALTCALCWWLAHEISAFHEAGRACRALVYGGLLVVPYAETLTGSHVIRDDLAQMVLLATFACTFRALRRGDRGWPFAVLAVLGAGLTTIIREDAIWMLASLAVLVGVVVRRSVLARHWLVATGIVALSALAYAGPRLVVTELNSRSGLDAPTLFDDAAFGEAHAAIARYINDGSANTRTLTPAMFDSLVTRSPSLSLISPGFAEWRREEGIVYLDAVRFAMAGGLDEAGVLADPARRTAVLQGVRAEVEALCVADSRPACDGWTPAPPPIGVVRVGDLVTAVRRPLTDWRPLLTVERGPLPTAGDDGSEAVLRQWERVTNTSPPSGSYTVTDGVVRFGERPHSVATRIDDLYLGLGRLVTPAVRVLGLAALGVLAWQRRWRLVTIAAVVLVAVWVRAAQVALATRFGVGDYDFHYLQPAATSIHVVALTALAGVSSTTRSRR